MLILFKKHVYLLNWKVEVEVDYCISIVFRTVFVRLIKIPTQLCKDGVDPWSRSSGPDQPMSLIDHLALFDHSYKSRS